MIISNDKTELGQALISKYYCRVWVALIFIIVIVSFSISKYNLFMDTKDALNISVLIGTMVTILWYTIETYRMKCAIKDQSELTLRPWVVAYVDDMAHKGLFIKNIGSGVAINIQVHPIDLNKDYNSNINYLKNEFLPIYYLEPKSEKKVANLNGEGETLTIHLHKKYGNIRKKITIEYENIVGKPYFQKIELGKGEPKSL